jgi:hypothetical protein
MARYMLIRDGSENFTPIKMKHILKQDSTPWRNQFAFTETLVLDKGCGIQFDDLQIAVFDKFV